MSPYRVCEIMKPEVDRQIQELHDSGLIVRSNSPMASPLVCVVTKQGGVRLACDYRYVNSFTLADIYPLRTVAGVICTVGYVIVSYELKIESSVYLLVVCGVCSVTIVTIANFVINFCD